MEKVDNSRASSPYTLETGIAERRLVFKSNDVMKLVISENFHAEGQHDKP